MVKKKPSRKPIGKGPHVVKLVVGRSKKPVEVPVVVPAAFVQALVADPSLDVKLVEPLEETGWQKFVRLFFTDKPAPDRNRRIR